jgi:hypothetical protein
VKVVSAIWPILGVLIGVLVGAYIADRIQKKQANSSSKKEEFRDLLTTLTQTARTIADFHGPNDSHSPEEERAYYEAKEKALIAIENRLFITTEIEKINLRSRWISAVHDVENGGHSDEFRRTVRQITRQIISAGKQLIK